MTKLSKTERKRLEDILFDIREDFDRLYKLFKTKVEAEKHSPHKTFSFTKIIETLYNTLNPVPREDIAEQSGCKKEYISRMIKILKDEEMVKSSEETGYRYGYTKTLRFMIFIALLKRKDKDMFPNIKNLKINTRGFLTQNQVQNFKGESEALSS